MSNTDWPKCERCRDSGVVTISVPEKHPGGIVSQGCSCEAGRQRMLKAMMAWAYSAPKLIILALLALATTGCAGVTTSAEYDAERGIWRFTVRGEQSPVVGVAVPQGSSPEQAVAAFAVRQSGGSAEAGRQTCVRAARLIAAAGAAAGASAGADALVARVLRNAAAAEAEAK